VLLGRQVSGTGFSKLKAYFIGENDLVVVTDHNVLRLDLSGRVRRRYFGRGTYRRIFSPAISPKNREVALVMDEPFRAYRNPDVSKKAMRRLDLQTGRLSIWKGDFTPFSRTQMEVRKSLVAISVPWQRIFVLDAQNVVKWSRHLPFGTSEEDRMASFKDFSLSKDGRHLFFLTAKSWVSQLNTQTLVETRLFPSADFTSTALSPDERFLLLGNSQGRLAIYNLKTRQLVRQVIFPFPTNQLIFSPNGKHLAIGGLAIVPFNV